jgi:hypothetical protein
MTISEVLTALKAGFAFKAWRRGWNDPRNYICIQSPGPDSKMTRPYLYMRLVADDDFIPWAPSQSDLFADDWEMAYA